MVDRGQGPFRVLYVTGRPNWDFKFLRRAIAEDDLVVPHPEISNREFWQRELAELEQYVRGNQARTHG